MGIYRVEKFKDEMIKMFRQGLSYKEISKRLVYVSSGQVSRYLKLWGYSRPAKLKIIEEKPDVLITNKGIYMKVSEVNIHE